MSQDEKWKNGEVSGCYRWAKLLAPVMIAFLGLFGGALVEVRTGAITTFITTIVTNISMGGTLQGSTGTTPQAPIGSTRQAPAGTTPVSPLQPLTGAFTPSLMMENSNCIPSQDGDRYIFQNTNTVAQCVLGLDAVAVDWQRLTSFEATMQIVESQSSEELSQGLYLHHPSGWYVFCGLTSDKLVVLVGPEIVNGFQNNKRVEVPADVSVSSVIRMDINPATYDVTCWKDGTLIGILNLESMVTQGARFHRTVGSYRPEGSTATTYISNILVAR